MTQYIFKQNIAGSNDGIEVVEYAKGSIVEGSQLSEYLTEKWLKSGVIELLKPEQEEEINSDRLKEIGVALNIPKMSNTVNPAKIIEKIRKFIEEYDAEK